MTLSLPDLFLTIAFAYAGLGALGLSIALFRTTTAPLGLYLGLWCASLAALHLRLVILDPLVTSTFAIYTGTMLMFSAGCIAVRVLTPAGPPRQVGSSSKWAEETPVLYRAVVLMFIVSMVGTLIYYRRVHAVIGIATLWEAPGQLRYEEVYGALRHAGAVGFLRGFAVPTAVLALIYLSLPKAPLKFRVAFIAIVSFAAVLPSTGRTVVFTVVFWAILAVVYTRTSVVGYIKLRIRTAAVLLGVATLTVTYFLVTSALLLKNVDVTNFPYPNRLPAGWIALADPYLYGVAPLVGFQEMLRAPWQFDTSSWLTFAAVARVLHEFFPQQVAYPEFIQPVVTVPVPVNVYTYLDSLFLDFGLAGVVLLPFVYGAACTAVFLFMMRRPTPFSIYLASLLGLCVMSTTVANRFGTIETWVRIVFVWGILLICRMAYRLRRRSAAGHPSLAGEYAR